MRGILRESPPPSFYSGGFLWPIGGLLQLFAVLIMDRWYTRLRARLTDGCFGGAVV